MVFLDGGRSGIRADPAQRASLRCIRCGACLNDCPVYERIGGHAYGWVYPGPIGSVITPGLVGVDRSRDLPRASSLCGRCGEVCPVKIPLPAMLLERRREDVETAHAPGRAHRPSRSERMGMRLFAWLASSPRMWRAMLPVARGLLRLIRRARLGGRLPGLSAWTSGRELPAPPRRGFRSAWSRWSREEGPGADNRRAEGDR